MHGTHTEMFVYKWVTPNEGSTGRVMVLCLCMYKSVDPVEVGVGESACIECKV